MPRRKKNGRRECRKKKSYSKYNKNHDRQFAVHKGYGDMEPCRNENAISAQQIIDVGIKTVPADMETVAADTHPVMAAIQPIRRGEIWYADLGIHSGSSVQGGSRPVFIISNDENNRYSSTVTVIPLTTKPKKMYLPTHVRIQAGSGNPLNRPSVVLAEQITTIDKAVLTNRVGELTEKGTIERIAEAVRIQMEL